MVPEDKGRMMEGYFSSSYLQSGLSLGQLMGAIKKNESVLRLCLMVEGKRGEGGWGRVYDSENVYNGSNQNSLRNSGSIASPCLFSLDNNKHMKYH